MRLLKVYLASHRDNMRMHDSIRAIRKLEQFAIKNALRDIVTSGSTGFFPRAAVNSYNKLVAGLVIKKFYKSVPWYRKLVELCRQEMYEKISFGHYYQSLPNENLL